MTDILDIAPVTRKVKTRLYGEVQVKGLSVSGIISLLKSHPKVFEALKGLEGEKQEINIEELLGLGTDFVADFMAAGLGHAGNKDAADKCREMNPEDVLVVCKAILEETFPGGVINFLETITAAIKSGGEIGSISLAGVTEQGKKAQMAS